MKSGPWIAVVIVGIVVALVGVLFLAVPLAPQPAATLSPPTNLYAVFSVSGFSLTGSVPVSISWTAAGGYVTLAAAACSSTCRSGNTSGLSDISVQTGTSGGFSITQPAGGFVVVVIVSFTSPSHSVGVTVGVLGGLPTEGSIMVIAGIVVLVLGVVLGIRTKPVSGPPAHPASPPEGATVPSMPPGPPPGA